MQMMLQSLGAATGCVNDSHRGVQLLITWMVMIGNIAIMAIVIVTQLRMHRTTNCILDQRKGTTIRKRI